MTQTSLAARALALFDAALDQPEAERGRYIDDHSSGDAALASEARLLLNAAGNPIGILELSPDVSVLPDTTQTLSAALDDRYEVLREIGRGGMATVFLARERKHNRDVVLKVLNPTLSLMCGAERFQREVYIAATLSHPHIVPLIDSGEAGGYLYYVMPSMDGRSLRAMLQDERPSHADAMRMLSDVAGALEFAHAAGVVHRDLKPENVLMASGHAYLLDFGIAKLASDATEDSNITASGFALGTRRYMAPEQVFAAAAVDARADIWAWGVLGTELLTGGPLPDGEPRVVARHVLERESGLSRALVALLLDCLSIDPADRPSDMSEVIARLQAHRAPTRALIPRSRSRRLLSAGIGAMALAALALALRASTHATTSALAEPIAVSVLRNETGDTSLTVLGRFAGDLITDGLQRLGVAKVVPWSGALLASEHAVTTGSSLVSAMHEETLAGTVVTGSYYRLRDSLHLQAQVVDAQSGELVSLLAPIVVPLATPELGVAQLRDRVLGAVASSRDERIAALPGLTRNPPSFSAYESFDQGLESFLAQKYSVALNQFQTAFERDTTFTAAAVWGARAALNVDSITTATHLAQRARATGSELGAFNDASLRYIEARLMGDGAAARSSAQKAAALAPNSRAGYDLAVSLLSGGYTRAARDQLLRMDPDHGEMRDWSSFWTQRANVEYLLGNHVEELRAARELHRRFPERRVTQVLEARALASIGDQRALDSALTAWQSLPANVYWSVGAAMVVASEELMRRGNETDGRRYAERAVTWLKARLAAAPNDVAHRYWMGSVLYDLERYQAARPFFESLARDNPGKLEYRGLAALVAARRHDFDGAARWLGPAAPHEIPLHMVFCARVAAISGKTENAITFLTSAADHGIEHYPWLAGAAFRDFAAVERDPRGKALLSGR